jgi:cytochrome oxidase Cu insertion factor (SCO1/SenC/PrrC family)
VCPTEVRAFQNRLDEFKNRNCSVVFISVDTKHSLWHWQNVPRQYGGLGPVDIPLLSDTNHRIATDYGVLMEDEGVSLRGMFIIDGEGIVQQVSHSLYTSILLILTNNTKGHAQQPDRRARRRRGTSLIESIPNGSPPWSPLPRGLET